jgi:polysaccharide export outer membrane protein
MSSTLRFRLHRLKFGFVLTLALGFAPPLMAQGAGMASSPMLQPGDHVRIVVWQKENLSGEFAVGPDSTLVHPLYREVRVAGVPLATAEQNLVNFLATYEGPTRLSFEPLFQVIIGGEVREAGAVPIPAGFTVAQAIGIAGGTTEGARLDRIELIRNGQVTRGSLLDPADPVANLAVRSGDQIRVLRKRNYITEVITPIGSVSGAFIALLSLLLR